LATGAQVAGTLDGVRRIREASLILYSEGGTRNVEYTPVFPAVFVPICIGKGMPFAAGVGARTASLAFMA